MATIELVSAFLTVLILSIGVAESRCSRGCDLALASYYVWPGNNLTFMSEIFGTSTDRILQFNPQIPSQYAIQADARVNIPFRCDCIGQEFLAHVFNYSVRSGDTYDLVANTYYSNLTTVDWLRRFNSFAPERIPDVNAFLNVTVNCSCGDESVSKDYGLFVTYPLRPGDSLSSIANSLNSSSITPELIQQYNPGVDFSKGSGLVYIPVSESAMWNYQQKQVFDDVPHTDRPLMRRDTP